MLTVYLHVSTAEHLQKDHKMTSDPQMGSSFIPHVEANMDVAAPERNAVFSFLRSGRRGAAQADR